MPSDSSNTDAKFTFGVGNIHQLPSRRQRQRLLKTAFDIGFRSFDVAPAYGDGLNELELGASFCSLRNEISITTKFGIPAHTYGERFPNLFPVIRLAEKYLSPSYGKIYSRRNFSANELRHSVVASLRRLNTSWIDRLCIHEPLQSFSEDEKNELLNAAQILKSDGKILQFGVSGEHNAAFECADWSGIDALQTRFSLVEAKIKPNQKNIAVFGIYRYFLDLQKANKTEMSFVDFVSSSRTKNPELELILSTKSVERLSDWRMFF